jgi:beta-galactosidase
MFYFGVDYYPEQWPEPRWPIDAQLMSEAGINVVRLAEFAWSRMEPEEGSYDFSWLDRVISILQAHGIRVILGTPTASPPPWLMKKSPDLFRMQEDGRRVTYGNRREYCPNSPLYHEYTCRIVTQLAGHFGSHPAVIGWQIDNEFGERCYCPVCAGKFQAWLRNRYEGLDDLNQKWGTIFWSHAYNDWIEIPLPLSTGGSPNPGLALDFYRFCSDSYVAYQQIQVNILRLHCPHTTITHNMMGFAYDRLNYFDLARSLDVVALDNYPRSQWSLENCPDPVGNALGLAAMRGLKRRNFWMLEQQSGSGGWEIISVTPRPGEMRLWAYQSIAHGADAIIFFRWRTARYGTEQYWHGLLDHDAHAGRRYEEIRRMGAEIKRVGDQILGSEIRSTVAMLLSYDSRFAFQIQPNNPHFSYPDHFRQLFSAFYKQRFSVDIVDEHADLSAYKLVVAPALHLLTPACAEKLKKYVQNGGTLLVTQRTGVKDETNAVVEQRLPGLLAEVCGVEVEEYDSLSRDMHNCLVYTIPYLASAGNPAVGVLCDILRPTTAQVLACYGEDYYAGKPAITLNSYGSGQALYVGAVGDEELYAPLVDWMMSRLEIPALLAVPAGIEVTERWQASQRLLFVLNHDCLPQSIELGKKHTNLLDDTQLEGKIQIEPYGVLILSPN